MSVSFDRKLAKLIRREAKRAGMSVSAWVARAAEGEARLAAAARLQEEWEAEHGPITDEELARAEALWPEE